MTAAWAARSPANGGNTPLAAAPFKGDSGSQDGSIYSFTVLADGTLQFEQEIAPATRYQFVKTLAADGEWAVAGESSARVHAMRLRDRPGASPS